MWLGAIIYKFAVIICCLIIKNVLKYNNTSMAFWFSRENNYLYSKLIDRKCTSFRMISKVDPT